MIETQYTWIKETPADAKAVAQLVEELGLPTVVAEFLVRRGYQSPTAAKHYLQPSLDALYAPDQMTDMDKAVKRIMTALERDEHIVVYGDYDVDGMTSTAIMTWALELLGADVEYFVPDRQKEGYGPNLAAYQRLAAKGMQLLITVDNGVTGHDEVAWLQDQQIDTIITDHHVLPAQLPDAYALLHPQNPRGAYPFTGLSGAGVAFKLASALLEAPADEVLDLAALGAVADVMPLIDENRDLVSLGLEAMRLAPRPGIAALLAKAGVDQADIDETTIGFTLAPRLNAIGRLADPMLGVKLLLTEDAKTAKDLAEQVEDLNQERKAVVAEIVTVAEEQARQQDGQVLVLAGHDWHEGVLGIVASHLVETYHKPTLVLNIDHGQAKGSGRSVLDFNLIEALREHQELFTALGGHAGAAGMTLPEENLEGLRQALQTAAHDQGLDLTQKPTLEIAAQVSAADFNAQNYEYLRALAPFGEGNPEPLFEVAVSAVVNPKTMTEGKHIRFTAETAAGSLPVVGFGQGRLFEDLRGQLSDLRIVGKMSANTFRGQTAYQLFLVDSQAQGLTLLDWRTSKLTVQTLAQPATYLFFNQRLYERLKDQIGAQGQAIWIDDAYNYTHLGTVALVDLPESLDQLQTLLQVVPAQRLAPIFYTASPRYLQKIPTKQDYAKVYRFVQSFKNVDLHGQFKAVAAHLGMDVSMLKLIFQVFLEANFVTIENGFLNSNPAPASVNLEATKAFQQFMVQRELEAKLIYSSTSELEALLNNLSKREN